MQGLMGVMNDGKHEDGGLTKIYEIFCSRVL